MSDHRPDIQGLRAVAILGVILFHTSHKTFQLGYLGVDIFFVISGHLICTTLNRSIDRNGFTFRTVIEFYYRRIARLLPLSTLYVIVALIAGILNSNVTNLDRTQMYAYRSLTFSITLCKVFYDSRQDAYEMYNWFVHIWSLCIEMQFYLLAPLFIFVQRKVHASVRDKFLPLICLISVVLYAWNILNFASIRIEGRLWQFFAVSIFEMKFQLAKKLPSIRKETNKESSVEIVPLNNCSNTLETNQVSTEPKVRNVILRACLEMMYVIALIAVSIVFIPKLKIHRVWSRVTVTIATAFIIAFGKDRQSKLLANQITNFIGDISYSLYIWHWIPVFYILTRNSSTFEAVGAVFASFAIAIVSYYLYEQKYRTWCKKKTLCVTVFLTVIAVFIAMECLRIDSILRELRPGHYNTTSYYNLTEPL